MYVPQTPVVTNSGQFQKGQSGNPAGRPPGARNKATLAAERLLEGALERLTGEAVELALDGNPQLLRLCISRMLPAARGRRVEIDLPAADVGLGGIAAALVATMRAAADGVISPLEAADLAGVIDVQRRTLETLELQRRLARLEAATAPVAAEVRRRELAQERGESDEEDELGEEDEPGEEDDLRQRGEPVSGDTPRAPLAIPAPR